MTKQQHPFEAFVDQWDKDNAPDSSAGEYFEKAVWNAALDWIDREVGAALADPFARDIIAEIIRRGTIDGI